MGRRVHLITFLRPQRFHTLCFPRLVYSPREPPSAELKSATRRTRLCVLKAAACLLQLRGSPRVSVLSRTEKRLSCIQVGKCHQNIWWHFPCPRASATSLVAVVGLWKSLSTSVNQRVPRRRDSFPQYILLPQGGFLMG